MSMQQIMRWGHVFPKDKLGGMLTLRQFGEKPCVMGRTHQNCQLPSFLSSLPNHLFYQKVVELVITWKGKIMSNFELGRAPSFGMSCFACMDKKTPEPYASFDTRVHVLGFTLTFLELGDVLFHHSFTTIFISQGSDIVVEAELFLCVFFTSASVFPLERL